MIPEVYKKNSSMIWALCVVPLLRVWPILVPKMQISFCPFLKSSQVMGLIPSPAERYFENWTGLFEEALLSL